MQPNSPFPTQTEGSITPEERILLKKIGGRIQQDLTERQKTAEWLAQKTGVARSTLREIIAGRSNPRVLTLQAIAVGLDYESAQHFLLRAFSDSR